MATHPKPFLNMLIIRRWTALWMLIRNYGRIYNNFLMAPDPFLVICSGKGAILIPTSCTPMILMISTPSRIFPPRFCPAAGMNRIRTIFNRRKLLIRDSGDMRTVGEFHRSPEPKYLNGTLTVAILRTRPLILSTA